MNMDAKDYSKRYENTLVAILFFSWGTVFLDRMSQLYLAPYIAPEFHLTHEQVGMLASVLAITWAVSTLVFGALSDRFGRRRILIPAVFAFSLLSWLSGVAHTFHQLLLVRALMGIAEGPCWSIMTALIEESSTPSRRGRNIGIVVSAGALVGLAVAPILTTQVAARFGWRWAFFVCGVPGILMGLLMWKFVKEPPKKSGADGERLHQPRIRDYFAILALPQRVALLHRRRRLHLLAILVATFSRHSTSPKSRIRNPPPPDFCSAPRASAVSSSDFSCPRCPIASDASPYSSRWPQCLLWFRSCC